MMKSEINSRFKKFIKVKKIAIKKMNIKSDRKINEGEWDWKNIKLKNYIK